MTDTWTLMAEARTDLADYLDALTPEQWDAPSLCEGWKVRDVVGHIVEGANKMSFGPTLVNVVKAGFNIDKMLNRAALEEGKRSPEDLKKGLRDAVPMRNVPPLQTPEHLLSDTVVHTGDIKRALGAPATVPEASLRVALDDMKKAAGFGGKKRIGGLRLSATDIDWTEGDGPEVRGTGEALLMAMCGRPVALADLEGDGLPTLKARVGA